MGDPQNHRFQYWNGLILDDLRVPPVSEPPYQFIQLQLLHHCHGMSCIFNKGCQGFWSIIHSTSTMALELWSVSLMGSCSSWHMNSFNTSQWVDDQRVHYPLYKYSCLDWGWSWYPWTRSSQMYQQLVWFSQKWGHLPILGGYTEESHDAGTREPIPLVSSRGDFFLKW